MAASPLAMGPARRRTGGPPLWAPGLAYALTTAAGVALFGGARPGAAPEVVLAAQQANSHTAGLSALLVFASAAPLAVWTAAAYQRIRSLGVRVAGPVIGLVGGVLAAAAIGASGLIQAAAIAVAPACDAGVAAALAQLAFYTGAAGFAVPFALLLAGVAVPGLIAGLLPRWLGVVGLVLSALGVLSVLTLVAPAVSPVLPLVRFGGLLWLLAVSILLPRHRARG